MRIKQFFASILMCVSLGAFAQTYTKVETKGLTDAQIADVKAYAAAKAASAAAEASGIISDPSATMTLAATWGTQAAEAAKGFASALSVAAKELGVTINDFLHTDAGRLTAALIIWKVAGAAIVHTLYGVVFAIVGMTITRVLYTRLFTKEYRTVEYSRFGGFFKGTKVVRIPKSIADLKNDGEWLAFWVMLIVCIGSLGIAGGIIA